MHRNYKSIEILKLKTMKNTFVGLALLSVIWLSGCAGVASPENKPGTSLSVNAKNEAIPNTVAEPVSNTSSSAVSEGAVVQLTKAMFLEKSIQLREKSQRVGF